MAHHLIAINKLDRGARPFIDFSVLRIYMQFTSLLVYDFLLFTFDAAVILRITRVPALPPSFPPFQTLVSRYLFLVFRNLYCHGMGMWICRNCLCTHLALHTLLQVKQVERYLLFILHFQFNVNNVSKIIYHLCFKKQRKQLILPEKNR